MEEDGNPMEEGDYPMEMKKILEIYGRRWKSYGRKK